MENLKHGKKALYWCRLMLIPGILIFGFGCQSKPALAIREASYPKDQVDARALFAESCAKCHGIDGRAKTFRGRLLDARNFTNAKWQTASTDPEIASAIKTGPKMMPAFGGKLSQSEIEALVAYVRSFKPVP
jgi:mono/diheme cytochrome c family protein